MKKTLILFIVLFAMKARGQTSTSNTSFTNYNFYFIEPLSALDFFNGPCLRLGSEFPLNYKYSLSITLGVYFEKGDLLKKELKRYYQNDEKERQFISIGYEYINHVHYVNDVYERIDSVSGAVPLNNMSVSYSVGKHINDFYFKYGYDILWKHHWLFEFYTGLGVRFKDANKSITDSVQSKLYHFNESMIEYYSFHTGHFVQPIALLGIKVGKLFALKKSSIANKRN